MDVKEITSQMREKLGDDFTKVEALMTRVEGYYESLNEDLRAANGESKKRKLELRKLQGELEDKDAEIETWKTKAEDSKNAEKIKTLENENKALKEFQEKIQMQTRETFKTKFEEVAKTEAFKKVNGKFKLPEPDKEGAYDLSKLSDEDIDYNIQKLEEYTELGIFAEQGHPEAHNNAQNLFPPDAAKKVQEIDSEDELNQFLTEVVKEY